VFTENRVYSTDAAQSVANQYAAMPSLHFGWAVIVATANHYWLKAAVALLLIVVTAVAVRPIAAVLLGRATSDRPWPMPSERRLDVGRCLEVSIASAPSQHQDALSAT
jgi:multisubunit Na+/H+ antiporter MnhG subunit